jgi:putative endonuclease
MWYTYVIQSLKTDYWYTGSTNDLRKRFNQHNAGKSTYTKKRGPYKLITMKLA